MIAEVDLARPAGADRAAAHGIRGTRPSSSAELKEHRGVSGIADIVPHPDRTAAAGGEVR
ncbi:hypothetical protein GCM10010964_26550 [Caldovatus sediminis]|uniref:Uncharacterized protein n=2 Tax=Caldovatus sediminis TaxID=2041189 RepID=A0A8J2ZC82_9PROT|nr:hypothetical protein GCM10010964_26550 [Caldovatus sediminis]